MKRIASIVVLGGLLALVATPAFAEDGLSARDIEAAVERYLANAEHDASLIGGAGSSGYDSGFWIKGGQFSLRINMTLQARFEYFLFDDNEKVVRQTNESILEGFEWPGGDLSGFSLPRANLKFSGTAPCNMRYYAELAFGHHGARPYGIPYAGAYYLGTSANPGVFLTNWYQYDVFREGWIEWGMTDMFNLRMGLIMYPNARQLMTAPELQQFADISMASAVTGALQPGWTDRNRDYGVMLHGTFGCKNEWQYMLAATNGDGGDHVRNVTNPLTSDNLMFSGRVNWAFLKPVGYTEGATRNRTCTWYGELGLWSSYYADRVDRPHTKIGNRLMVGGDLALGYGGFSMTGGFTYFDFSASELGYPFNSESWYIALVQVGYLFPKTPWEVAARWSWYQREIGSGGPIDSGSARPQTHEIGAGLNYYLNGHGNKLQIDFSYYAADADGASGAGYYDAYTGVPLGFASGGNHFLIRFQWQLAL